jgi:sugar O-acyltransferase (sialic acid O-acetyltransferase NeuD family)
MTDKQKICIVGAGGFGREVYHLLFQNDGETIYDCVGFVDCGNNTNLPVPIIGHESQMVQLITKHDFSNCVFAIGKIQKRKTVYGKIKNHALKFPKIIDSSVKCYSVDIAEGAIIYPGAVIMNDCKIGKFSLINSGVTLGHEVVIGNFCNINPGVNIAGRVEIGDCTFVGIGACIKDKVSVGTNVIIGAGSVVLRNVPDNTMVYGVPAKVVNH